VTDLSTVADPGDLLDEMRAAGFTVRKDQTSDGRYRVRVERHSGRTFHDYRATTRSASSMNAAIRAAYRKWQAALDAGEIPEPYDGHVGPVQP